MALGLEELDACNCATIVLLCRHIQVIEDVNADRLWSQRLHTAPGQPALSTSSCLGDVSMGPALRDWIATELREKAAQQRERRRSRGERQWNRAPPAAEVDTDKD